MQKVYSQNNNEEVNFEEKPKSKENQGEQENKPKIDEKKQTQLSTDMDTPYNMEEASRTLKTWGNNDKKTGDYCSNKEDEANLSQDKKIIQKVNHLPNQLIKTEGNKQEITFVQNNQNQIDKKQRKRIKTPNFVKTIQYRTNFPAIYVILSIMSCGLFVFFGSYEILLTNLIGFVFPMYWTIRGLNKDFISKEDEKQWYTYWFIYLSMLPFDMLFGWFLKHFPLFYFGKYLLLCWLFLPNYNGSEYIHETFIKKKFPEFDLVKKIDDAADRIRKQFNDFTKRIRNKILGSKGFETEKIKKRKAKEEENYVNNENKRYIDLKEEEKINDKTNNGDDFNKQNNMIESSQVNKNKDNKDSKVKKNDQYESNQPQSEKENKKFTEKGKDKIKEKDMNINEKLTKENTNTDNLEINKEKDKENLNREDNNYFFSSNANKPKEAYDKLISHIHELKNKSGKAKDIINSTVEKIWKRIHEESFLKKGNQEKKLFESEEEKRRYEEQMRERHANESEKFSIPINRAFPVEEQETRNFFEKNEKESNTKNKQNINEEKEDKKNIKNEKPLQSGSKDVGLEKNLEKDYPNKNENFKVKEGKRIPGLDISEMNKNYNENKENIRSENVQRDFQKKNDAHAASVFEKESDKKSEQKNFSENKENKKYAKY